MGPVARSSFYANRNKLGIRIRYPKYSHHPVSPDHPHGATITEPTTFVHANLNVKETAPKSRFC